jgi:alkylation response protein AidB-like acyl-CoA dehydrogenase
MDQPNQSSSTTPQSTGFVHELFFGKFNEDSMLPYYEQSDSERAEGDATVATINKFCRTYVFPDQIDAQGQLEPSVLQELGDLSVLGMTLDQSFGGAGVTHFNFCRVMETIGARCGSTATAVSQATSVIGALATFGSDEQKETWLPKLIDGEISASLAVTETLGGVCTDRLRTTAKNKDGQFVIDGEKRWVSNAPTADLIVVLAATPDNNVADDAATAFLVTPDLQGVTVEDSSGGKLGNRGVSVGNLRLDGVSLLPDAVLGNIGDGQAILAAARQSENVLYAAAMLGTGKSLLQRMVERAKFRKQSGKSIGQFGLVQEKIALAAANMFALESAVYHVAAHLDIGQESIQNEAIMLKLAANSFLWQIVNDAMDIWGGKSLFNDQSLERDLRNIRYSLISEGANDVLQQQLVVNAIQAVGDDLKTLTANWWQAPKKIYVGTPSVTVKHEHLRFHSRWIGSHTGKFGWSLKTAYASNGKELLQQQLQSARLAKVATGLFLSSCVYAKLTATLVNGTIPEPAQRGEFETGNLFLMMTRDYNDGQFEQMKVNHDDEVAKVAEVWLNHSFAGPEEEQTP